VTLRPTAHGSLGKTPFAHLLLYLQGRKLSGTLAIWPEDRNERRGQNRVLFEGGVLTAMRPIEPAKSLYAALIPLFGATDAPYGFYEGQNLLGQGGALQEPIDPYTLLSRGLRAHANDAVMDGVIERVRGRPLRLRPDLPLDRLELNQREAALLEPLRAGAATIDQLLSNSVLPMRDAKRTLYLLTLLRGLEATGGRGSIPSVGAVESFAPPASGEARLARDTLGDAPAPSDETVRARNSLPTPSLPPPEMRPRHESTRPSAPPAPLGLSAQDEARWNELTRLYERLDELNHYDLLNLPHSIAAQDVQPAYYALVKKFHPDRLPLALAPLARAAQVLFERLTEASETLGQPELRAEYDRAVAGGGGTRAADRVLRNVLESALEFQKAEVLVRRREYQQALTLLRSALSKSPDEADYHALYAYILHLMNPTEPAPFDEMLRGVDKALASNPQHERAHYTKGVILKRLKRDREAVRHFRAASEINPHNVDAAREVRLAVLRRSSSSKPPASGQQGGMLSRLFKK
jgi:curved DNA-binding protein CbpA